LRSASAASWAWCANPKSPRSETSNPSVRESLGSPSLPVAAAQPALNFSLPGVMSIEMFNRFEILCKAADNRVNHRTN